MYSMVASNHRWNQAPEDLKEFIVAHHGEGPWAVVSVVPKDQNIPTMTAGVQGAPVTVAVPGGLIVAWRAV